MSTFRPIRTQGPKKVKTIGLFKPGDAPLLHLKIEASPSLRQLRAEHWNPDPNEKKKLGPAPTALAAYR